MLRFRLASASCGLSFEIREVGAFWRVIKLHELVALFHALPGFEINVLHLAGDLRRHIDLLVRRERADGCEGLGDVCALGDGHFHRGRWRLVGCKIAFHRGVLEAHEEI